MSALSRYTVTVGAYLILITSEHTLIHWEEALVGSSPAMTTIAGVAMLCPAGLA